MRARSLVFAVILAGCSCDGGTGASDAGRPPPTAPVALDAQQRVLREWLRAQAVSETHFGVTVLYTWIGESDLEDLSAGGSIATTTASATHPLDALLEGDTSDVAQRLRALPGRRPAWPSVWGSRFVGASGEHLVRVELRPESLLLVYDVRTSPPTMHFATDRGTSAPFDEASHVPELWAAVLVVGEDRHDDGRRSPWREYVLVSPAMIGRVSMASTEIAGELRTSRERLTRLAHDAPDVDTAPSTAAIERAWAALPGPSASLETTFTAAIPGDRCRLNRHALQDLIAHLVDHSAPFEWRTSIPSEPRPQYFE